MAVTFVKERWSDEAAAVLKPAMCGDDEIIIEQVTSGIAELFKIPGYGFIITRIEGSELVLMCAAGRGGIDVMAAIDQMAAANGLKTVRLHSRRRGMERYIKKAGYKLMEKVFYKQVAE